MGNVEVPLWGIFEGMLKHPEPPASPLRDVSLNGRFTGPDGREVEWWGFFDGGDIWRIRFMPDTPGTWRYEVVFSDGKARDGGEFEVVPSSIPGMLDRDQGNPQWFGFRGGRRVLVRALHVGDRFFAENWEVEKRRAFLDWAQEQGYNTLSIASHYLNRPEEGRGKGWNTPRLWPLDPAEYRKMEAILDDLAMRGIMVFPFAGFFGKRGNYPRESADQELYVRYTLARLGAYWNLLFNVAGPEPNVGRGWMAGDDVERLGWLISGLDVFGHPLSVHNRTGDDAYRDRGWLTYGTLQGPKTVDQKKLGEELLRNHHPRKPLLAQETLWSGNVNHIRACGRDYTAGDLRRNAYVLEMSAAALVYADHDGNSSTGFSGTMELAERKQERHDIIRKVWDFFETVPYYQMTPRPDLVSRGHCLADDGQRILVYLSGPGPVDVELEGEWIGEWIDGRESQRRVAYGVLRDGRGLRPPEEDGDWLLYLTRTGAEVPDQVHLSWTGDAAESLTVTWHTMKGGAGVYVDYRQVGEGEWMRVEARSFDSPGKGFLHRAALDGLTPASGYEYRPAGGAVHRTRTAPREGDFTFAFISGTGLIGRLDGNATGTRQVMHELLRDDPLFVLGGGDYAYANKDGRFASVADAIDAWFLQSEEILARFPFIAQYGNHEIHLEERYEDWAPRFAHPEGFDGGRNYSFQVGDAHFTGLFVPGDDLTDEQLEWLNADLARGRKEARWLVVFQHESIYGHGTSHPAHPGVRARLAPIFERYEVDLHLSAHDQNYERTFPLVNVPEEPTPMSTALERYEQGEGVVYAKVSPAGKMSEIGDQFSQLPEEQQAFMAVRDCAVHHYALVHVKAKGEIEVEVFSVVGDGTPKSLLDRFVIVGA